MSLLEFSKGHNSVKKVGRETVLVLSTLSINALYLYQIFMKISQRGIIPSKCLRRVMLYNFVKIYQRVSGLLSGHSFRTKNFIGA